MIFGSSRNILGFIGWFIFCFGVSALGAIASINAQTFYGQLIQPGWAPPAWVFGPVWTVLYAMMAISVWLVWRSGGFRSNLTALSLFIIQLGLNGLWSWMFFAWHQGALAFINVLLLWVFIALTLFHFWRAKPLAAALLVPYLFWVTFASALNYAMWQLNPVLLG